MQTSIIYPYEGQTPKGPKYGTAYSSLCRFEHYKKKMVDATGKEFSSTARIFLPVTTPNVELELDSKIVVDNVSYILKEKQKMMGFSLSHIEGLVV